MEITNATRSQGEFANWDSLMGDFAASSAAKPSQVSIDELLTKTHAVRVLEGGNCHREGEERRLLAETSEPAALASLRATLQIVDPGEHCIHCMCCGDPSLEFVAADGSRLALISIHHGKSIRWQEWRSDARLVDGVALAVWLAERGIDSSIKEFAREVEADRKWEVDRARWRAAMPPALVPFWPAAENSMGMQDVTPLKSAIESSLPDERGRIRMLLEWFGSGAGPWSGFPAYEIAAERLLLEYSTANIVASIESAPTTFALREGAARLFAGSDFLAQRPTKLDRIPGHLKRLLWVHSKYTRDDDKRARAQVAFAMYGWRAFAQRVLRRFLQ